MKTIEIKMQPVSQVKQLWSKIIQSWGCNIMCMLSIIIFYTQKKITAKDFYSRLLKYDVVREKNESDYAYIRDYYMIFKIYGIEKVSYHVTTNFNYEIIADKIFSNIPIKARCKTKSGYHFMIIHGYTESDFGKIIFNVIDPMERDDFVDSETWEFFSMRKGDREYSGRVLDRIEWFEV